VPTVAVLRLHDLSLVLLDFVSGRLHLFHVDDVIAAINTVGLVHKMPWLRKQSNSPLSRALPLCYPGCTLQKTTVYAAVR
jgi:hypothetical protein